MDNKFKFDNTTEDDVYSKIKSLDPKETCTENDISAKTLIGTNDIVSGYLSIHYTGEIIPKLGFTGRSIISVYDDETDKSNNEINNAPEELVDIVSRSLINDILISQETAEKMKKIPHSDGRMFLHTESQP